MTIMKQRSHELLHGSHPQHPFVLLPSVPHGELCSICRATAYYNDEAWYLCTNAACRFLLCDKCFKVEETLLDAPQIVILNPRTPPDCSAASVHTRPRPNSYVISPIYPAKLMEVVSSARCAEDPRLTYYRLIEGGWINAAHVLVCDQPCIAALAAYHLCASKAPPEEPIAPPRLQDLRGFMEESIALLRSGESSAYGIVMASLTLYPVLRAVSEPVDGLCDYAGLEYVKDTAGRVLELVAAAMDFSVGELRFHFDNEEALDCTTLLSLHCDVLSHCLQALGEINQQWRVCLSPDFHPLVLEAATLLGRVCVALQNHRGAARELRIGTPATLPSPHVSFGDELRRVHQLCRVLIAQAARLLLRHVPLRSHALAQLEPMREVLSEATVEVLEKTFCELLAHLIEACPAENQAAFMDLDPLEIVVRIAETAEMAESQISALRLVTVACRKSPGNIATAAAVALDSLVAMTKEPRSAVVVSAAIDCFTALAYNDPCGSGGAALAAPYHAGCLWAGGQPLRTPFQRMHCLSAGGALVALCDSCAQFHRPPHAAEAREPQFGFFHCQCVSCRHQHEDPREGGSPAVDVPSTSAMGSMTRLKIPALVSRWVQQSPAQVANAVGRLALQFPLPDATLALLAEFVFQCATLEAHQDAALAVAANRALPCVKQLLTRYPGSALRRYLDQPYTMGTPVKADPATPAYSHRHSDGGLSPSPQESSAYRSTLSDAGYVNGRHMGGISLSEEMQSATP